MSVAGPVARAQGAITAFQAALGEVVAFAAEQSERADLAERALDRLERDMHRRLREEYRRGYSTGHAAASRGAACAPDAARERGQHLQAVK